MGRVLDGKLGALGRDGIFHDDGRFHELPAKGAFDPFACSALDANGRIFNNVTVGEEPASGTWLYAKGSCVAPHADRSENPGTSGVVPVDSPITELHYRDGSTCLKLTVGSFTARVP